MSIWRLGNTELDCTTTCTMAILNATPDSFYSGSKIDTAEHPLEDQLTALLNQQPDIIDVGGQSTRPGSTRVAVQDEIARAIPVITELRRLDAVIPITVDTYSATVARAALDAGADGINDISAGCFDAAMLPLVAARKCGYVLTHMQGSPESMQQQPGYNDCVAEVRCFLKERLAVAEAHGVSKERIVLDPGIGFGKRLEDNLALLTHADELLSIGRPLLYGVSRKSYIAMITGENDSAKRLPGTLGTVWALLDQGVMLHRVHDVTETRQLMQVWKALHAQTVNAPLF